METIVAAAIQYDELTISMPAPLRHHHIAHKMYQCGLPVEAQREQGFITSAGRYVDRKEAFCIAFAAQQLIMKTNPLDTLFSEDVW